MSRQKPDGGVHANTSGRLGEQIIHDHLLARGYQEAEGKDRTSVVLACNAGADPVLLVKPGFFYTQIPAYQSIYKAPFKADFVVAPFKAGNRPVLIEMKYQGTSGSVDEKLPFWLLSLEAIAPTMEPVLVVLGDGVRDGALTWCHTTKREVRVLTSTKSLRAYMSTI
jgi:hypothetical protein